MMRPATDSPEFRQQIATQFLDWFLKVEPEGPVEPYASGIADSFYDLARRARHHLIGTVKARIRELEGRGVDLAADRRTTENLLRAEARILSTAASVIGDRTIMPPQFYSGDRLTQVADRGGFGDVIFASSESGADRAVKIYRNPSPEFYIRNLREIHFLSLLHGNQAYVQYQGCWMRGDKLAVAMKKYDMNLKRFIEQNRDLPASERISLLLQTAEVMKHFHDEVHSVHRDLKPENLLLLSPDNTVSLTDFGTAMELCLCQGTICGSAVYMDPVLLCRGYGDMSQKSCDVFSFGMVVLHVWEGVDPQVVLNHPDHRQFLDDCRQALALFRCGVDVSRRLNGFPEVPNLISSDRGHAGVLARMNQLFQNCVQIENWENRPSFSEIVVELREMAEMCEEREEEGEEQ